MKKPFSNKGKKWLGFWVISACWLVVLFVGLHFNFVGEIESRTWDWRLRAIAGSQQPDPKIKLILIDQSSLDHFARVEKIFWPWPRQLYVPVIKFLERAEAKGVAFDLLFSESSTYGVEDDQKFADAIESSLPVIMAVAPEISSREVPAEVLSSLHENQTRYPIPSKLEQLLSVQLARDSASSFTGVVAPISELRKASHSFGSVSTAPDSDGVFRHAGIGSRLGSLNFLSLPFAAYSATATEAPVLDQSFLDQEGRLALRFLGAAGTFKRYPISSIIKSFQQIEEGQEPLVRLEEFKDSVVFVGVEAPGLLDLRPTPLAENLTGVEYNATVLDNIRNQRFIRKSSILVSLGISACFILLTAGVLIFIHSPSKSIVGVSAILIVMLTISYFAALYGWWLPLVNPLIACFGCGLVSLGFQLQLEGRQHRFIRRAFRHYVNDTLIEKMVNNPSALALGGERKELSIFFGDIEGFTKISEGLDPSKLVALLNLFLTEMTKIVMRHGGTVDKYVGDAVVAFWNAPISDPEHAYNAVKAALECQSRMQELQPQFTELFGCAIRVRIGIHSGLVNVGNFGSDERFNYTVVGDAANLASRIEGVNKLFGTYTLVSEETKQAIGDRIRFRKVGSVRVFGRSAPVSLYEPVSSSVSEEELAKFHLGLSLVQQGNFAKALSELRSLPQTKLTELYIGRIENFVNSGRPAVEWSQIWNMADK